MRSPDTKQRIQTEALRLFAENGYPAVTMEQIAAAGWDWPLADQEFHWAIIRHAGTGG